MLAFYFLFLILGCFPKLFVCLIDRISNRERQLLSAGSFPKCLQQAWAGTRSPELSPGFPCEYQGLNYSTCHLLSPKMGSNRKPSLGLELELQLELGHYSLRYVSPNFPISVC